MGFKKHNNDNTLVLFSLADAEILIPNSTIEGDDEEPISLFEEDVKPLGTKTTTFIFIIESNSFINIFCFVRLIYTVLARIG